VRQATAQEIQLKRSVYQSAHAPERLYEIAFDERHYTLSIEGKMVASVGYDAEGLSSIGDEAVLLQAQNHVERMHSREPLPRFDGGS